MKRTTIVVISLLIVLAACNCDKPTGNNDKPVPDEVENPLWPFYEGNWWLLDVWDNESGENLEYFERYEVVSLFRYEDHRVAEVRLDMIYEDSVFASFTMWIGNTDTGLYLYAPYENDFEPFSSPKLLYKHPAEDGEIFESYALDETQENTDPMQYLGTGLWPVEVPAGIFVNCGIYYGCRPPADETYNYFIPDTGYVRMEKYVASSLVKTRSLSEFHLSE